MKALFVALGAVLVMAAGESALVLHPLMKDVVAPQSVILWDVGNRGMDDQGNPSAKALKPGDWTKLATAALAMQDAGTRMAAAQKIMLVTPGAKIQDQDSPGSATPEQIQGFIDKDSKDFATHARELAAVSAEFLAAAKGKDAVKLAAASGRLDEVCEGCHTKYWYPTQPAK